MTDNTIKLDRDGLNALVRTSKISVAHTDADATVITVYSESEPFFCYDANSIGEVQNLVVDTYRSYARNFHDVEDFQIDFRVVGDLPGLPIERVLSTQALEPVFDEAA